MALNPSDYGRRVQLTGLVPASPLNGFVALATIVNMPVEAVDQGTFSALNGGGDLAFSTDALGVNQLPLEVVTFVTSTTPANRQCQLWVRFPTYSTAARSVYMFYNRAGQTQPPVTDPFGRNAVWSDYVAVWHGITTDSTGNGFTLSEIGSPTKSTNIFGGESWVLDGSTQYLQNAVWTKVLWPMQMECWTALNSTSGTATYHSQGGSSGWDAILKRPSNVEVNIDGANSGSGGSLDLLEHYVVTQIDTSLRNIYEDGVALSLSNATVSRTQDAGLFTRFNIGSLARNANDLRLNGMASEVRVKNSVDSSDLITLQHSNQRTPNTFWTTGTPETPGGGITVTAESQDYNINFYDGTVSLTGEIAVTGGAQSHNVTFYDATIDLTGEVLVNAESQSYQVQFFDAQVSLISGIEVQAQTQDYDVTFFDASVQLSGEININAETQAYSVTFYDATVSITELWTDKPKAVTNWTDQEKTVTIWTDR